MSSCTKSSWLQGNVNLFIFGKIQLAPRAMSHPVLMDSRLEQALKYAWPYKKGKETTFGTCSMFNLVFSDRIKFTTPTSRDWKSC